MTQPTNDASATEAVLFEVDGGVATITLNRPEQLNAINGDLGGGLSAALQQVRDRDDIRVAMLTGNGRAFCAGADLRSRAGGPAAAAAPHSLLHGRRATGFAISTRRSRSSARSTASAWAAASRSRSSATCSSPRREAAFALPEITLGFFPLAGAPVRLPRSIPRAFANDMLFTRRTHRRRDARCSSASSAACVPADGAAAHGAGDGDAHRGLRARSRCGLMRDLVRRQADLPAAEGMRLGRHACATSSARQTTPKRARGRSRRSGSRSSRANEAILDCGIWIAMSPCVAGSGKMPPPALVDTNVVSFVFRGSADAPDLVLITEPRS